MRALRFMALGLAVALSGSVWGHSARGQEKMAGSARAKLIGAWRLVAMDEAGPDGTMRHVTNRTGVLVYTRDGHMSVQIMFPMSEAGLSNDYVQNGYEASFGSYDVDEAAHTVTHHVAGSLTRGLVGKDLPRVFELAGKTMIIKSTRPDEHWSVMWERYE